MYLLETPRLGLRDWLNSDIPHFVEMNQDPKVMEFFPKTLSELETKEMVRRLKEHIQEKGYGFWAVELRATKEFIGFVGLETPRFEAEFTPCVEIGWRLAPKYWHKGYAQEAAKECLKFGFKQLNLKKIVAFTSVLNKRSIHVMRQIGMHYVKEFEHPNIEQGNPVRKHVLYSILSSHFIKNEKRQSCKFIQNIE